MSEASIWNMIYRSADGQLRLCALDYGRTTNYGSWADKSLHELHAAKLMDCLWIVYWAVMTNCVVAATLTRRLLKVVCPKLAVEVCVNLQAERLRNR